MGADGGINWIRLTGEYDEAVRLIRPLHLLWDQSGTGHDSEHYEALDGAILPLHGTRHHYLYSVYGTDVMRGGMDELAEIIEYWQSLVTDRDWYWEETDPLTLTWEEILADFLTKPNCELRRSALIGNWGGWLIYPPWTPSPVRLMHEEYGSWFDKETLKIQDRHWMKPEDLEILRSPISRWLTAIELLVDPSSTGREETWT